jgi:predicted secreted protein
MPFATGLALYFTIWWITLFVVLPFGTRRDDNPQPGHADGAPLRQNLWRKVGWNTLLAAIVWLLIYGLVVSGWISFRAMVQGEP